LFRLRNAVLALLLVVALIVGAILAAGLNRLPGPAEWNARYRAGGQPTGLAEINPHLIIALDAEGSDLAHALAQNECKREDRGFVGWHTCLAVSAVSARLLYFGGDLRLWWMNTTYFGHASYGVSAGARSWFGKDQRDLTPAEAAFLVPLTRQPAAARDSLRQMFDRLADRMQIP